MNNTKTADLPRRPVQDRFERQTPSVFDPLGREVVLNRPMF
jgi:hypothetical protein